MDDSCDLCTVCLLGSISSSERDVNLSQRRPEELERGEGSFNWQLAGLSSKLIQSTSKSGLTSTETSSTHVRHALYEVKDTCTTLFHLLKAISLVRNLIPGVLVGSLGSLGSGSSGACTGEAERVCLSFPRGQPIVASPVPSAAASAALHSGTSGRQNRRGNKRSVLSSEDDDQDGVIAALDADKSQKLLLTWSGCAADAFVGEFVLPAGISVNQALS